MDTCPPTSPAQSPLPLQLCNYLRIRWIAVHIDDTGPPVARSTQQFLKEALGRIRVTVSRKQEINSSPAAIDGTVQVGPFASHANVGLIHPPGAVGGLQFP